MNRRRILLAAIAVTAGLIVVLTVFLLARPILDGDGQPLPKHFKYTVEGGVAVITKYTSHDAHVVIPSHIDGRPVGVIGYEAFKDKGNLVSVVIPDTVTYIGVSAFYGCRGLTGLELPDGLEIIGAEAFTNCVSLDKMVLSPNVETIGRSAFEGCVRLTEITLPAHLKELGDMAFRNCRRLTGITIPSEVEIIGLWSFLGCRELAEVRFSGPMPEISDPQYKVFYEVSENLNIRYAAGTGEWPATWDDFPVGPLQ